MEHAGGGWDGISGYSIRCVRNINMDGDEGYAPAAAPMDYVEVYTINKDDGKKTPVKPSYTFSPDTDIYFDLQYLNSRSFRLPVGVSDSPYEPTELVMANEKHNINNLSEAFVATNRQPATAYSAARFKTTNDNVTNSMAQNPYCPEGYRLANQRELTMMGIYAQGFMTSGIMSRTSYSLGSTEVGGNGKDSSKYGYNYNGTINVSNADSGTSSRCVKDILPQNLPK
jgi:hypothetical protein